MIRLAACIASLVCTTAFAGTHATVHGSVVRQDGAHIAYHVRPGDGPTLVLIPGSWGDYQVFDGFMETLDPSFHVVIVELRGHGDSQPPAVSPDMALFADDVLAVIRALGLKDYFVGGHSIGGMVPIEIAGRAPEGMIGVVALEGWTHHTVQRNAFAKVEESTLTEEETATRNAWRERVQKNLTPEQIDAFAQVWKQWNGYPILETTPLPILEVWGDRAHPPADRETMQIPDRPNIEVVWLEGVSHSFLIEDPNAVAQAVNAFIHKHAKP